MARFSSLSEARAAKIAAMKAGTKQRAKTRELLAMLASAPLRPRKEQEGHAETPLFQTTLEQFL